MFTDKNKLLDYLLTSDFTEKLTEIEYKFLLLAYKENFRSIHSINTRLNNEILELKEKINKLEYDKSITESQFNVKNLIIENLKKRLIKKLPWYKKIFK